MDIFIPKASREPRGLVAGGHGHEDTRGFRRQGRCGFILLSVKSWATELGALRVRLNVFE